MKEFLFRLLIFVSIVFLLALVLDVVITKGLRKFYSYDTEVMNDIRDSSINPDMIVLGSCQAGCCYNPEVLDSVLNTNSYCFAAYNLTLPAHMAVWNEYKLYHSKLPKYILLTIDYGDLHTIHVKNNIVEKQFIHLIYDKPIRDYMINDGGYKILEIYIPLVRYFGYSQYIKDGILGLFEMREGSRNRYKGYERMSIGYQFSEVEYPDSIYIPIENEKIEILSEFIKDLKDNGIKTILVTAPLGNDLAKKIINANDVYNICDSLSILYNIPYLQYQNHSIASDTSLFESPAHLNYYGADVFTEILADSLLTIKY